MFMDRLANGSRGKEKKIAGEKGDNWISSTWNRQEERKRKAEANKNNLTSLLKLDDLLPFLFGLLSRRSGESLRVPGFPQNSTLGTFPLSHCIHTVGSIYHLYMKESQISI